MSSYKIYLQNNYNYSKAIVSTNGTKPYFIFLPFFIDYDYNTNMIEKKPYVRVNLPLTPKESNDLLSLSFNDEIQERMEKTIEVEAPIRRTLLYKRVINSFGLLKVGSRLLSLFDSISSELSNAISEDYDGETVFHSTEDEDFFRPSPDSEDRYSYQIPSSEAASCLLYVMDNTEKQSLTKSQLYREFISEMGWEKSGNAIEKLFSAALQDNRIKRSGNGRILK